jgi:hypothetical protein
MLTISAACSAAAPEILAPIKAPAAPVDTITKKAVAARLKSNLVLVTSSPIELRERLYSTIQGPIKEPLYANIEGPHFADAIARNFGLPAASDASYSSGTQ